MKFDAKKLVDARSDENIILDFIKQKDLDLLNYIEEFIEKKENKEIAENNYDIAIYTIGFSPYTTLLSISALRPKEKIILIFTKESLKFKQVFIQYFKLINLNCEVIIKETIYDSNTAEVFNIMTEEIKRYHHKNIAVDITGGKKPTIASGYLAASLSYNIDILYLDFYAYKDDKPVYGTEYLNILLNPNNIFNTLEKNALEEMYISKNFKGARRLSKQIEKRLKKSSKILNEYNIDNQIKEIEKIYYFSKLYELRNDFNYEDINIKEEYLNKDEIYGIKVLSNFLKKVKDLGEKPQGIEIYKEFKSSDDIFYMCIERYNGALMIKDIDLQSYIIRLLSAIELAGVVLTKGEKENSIQKIDSINEKIDKIKAKKIINDLHELRQYRNGLNLNHGFKHTRTPSEKYEEAVRKYIAYTFDKEEEEVSNILINQLRYREYKDINI